MPKSTGTQKRGGAKTDNRVSKQTPPSQPTAPSIVDVLLRGNRIVKPKRKAGGRPFQKGNTHGNRFKSKAELGGQVDPNINIGGRAKTLGTSYKQILESRYPSERLTEQELELVAAYTGHPDTPITYAEMIGLTLATIASMGDVRSATELRTATEGSRVNLATWQTEIIDALKNGNLSPEDLIRELGADDARAILIAAGIPIVPVIHEPEGGQASEPEPEPIDVDPDTSEIPSA